MVVGLIQHMKTITHKNIYKIKTTNVSYRFFLSRLFSPVKYKTIAYSKSLVYKYLQNLVLLGVILQLIDHGRFEQTEF